MSFKGHRLGQVNVWRRGILLVVVGVLIAGLVPGSFEPASAADPKAKQKQLNSELKDLKNELHEVSGDEADLLKRLNEIKARKADIDRQIADVEAKMADAQRRLDAATASLQQSQAQADQAQGELNAAKNELAQSTKDMQEQAVDAYVGKDPGNNLANFVFRAEDMRQLTAAGEYLHQIVSDRRTLVEEHRELQGKAEDLKKVVDAKRAEAEKARNAIEEEKNALAGKHGELDQLHLQAEAEVRNQNDLLAQAEAKRGDIEREMRDLQAQSDAIAAQLRAAQAAAAPSGGGGANAPTFQPGSGRISNPVPGSPMSSPFGMRTHPIFGTQILHAGQDYAAAQGTPIHAAAEGTVVTAGWVGGYGNYTCINHGGGLATCYGHQSQIKVSVGQHVARGQVIGLVGSTGNSTGPHLHFETRVNGTPVNPLNYL